VLIWLGEAGPATQEALAKLDQIGEVREAGEVHLRSVLSELYQRAREASKELNSYDSSASDLELAKVNEDKDSALQELKKDYLAIFEMENQPLWGGIVDLFSQPYWNCYVSLVNRGINH
jgi:hydroxymethylpyrimidine pyrophosphatase-like HAD family hydrolase